jgi:hypothetical protein
LIPDKNITGGGDKIKDDILDTSSDIYKICHTQGGIITKLHRPPSPSNSSTFPYGEVTTLNNNTYNDSDPTQDNSEQHKQYQESVDLTIQTYTIIADKSMTPFVISKTKQQPKGGLADTGANCSMTADLNILQNIIHLKQPITIGLALTGNIPTTNECHIIGDYPVTCDDGSTILTKCFYNPNASDTIISPQSIIDSTKQFHTWEQIGRQSGQPGQLKFIGPNETKTITLHQHQGLYFCTTKSYEVKDDTNHYQPEDSGTIQYSSHTLNSTQQPLKPKRQPKPTATYKPSSKTAWCDDLTMPLVVSIYRMFSSVAVYPINMPVKSCLSSLALLLPDILTQTLLPNTFNALKSGCLPHHN